MCAQENWAGGATARNSYLWVSYAARESLPWQAMRANTVMVCICPVPALAATIRVVVPGQREAISQTFIAASSPLLSHSVLSVASSRDDTTQGRAKKQTKPLWSCRRCHLDLYSSSAIATRSLHSSYKPSDQRTVDVSRACEDMHNDEAILNDIHSNLMSA